MSIYRYFVCPWSKQCEKNRKRKGWATMKVWEKVWMSGPVSIYNENTKQIITIYKVYSEKYLLCRSNCCCIPLWKDTAGVWGNNNAYSLCCLQQQQVQHSTHSERARACGRASEREPQQRFTILSLPLDIKWAIKVVPAGSLPQAKKTTFLQGERERSQDANIMTPMAITSSTISSINRRTHRAHWV